MKIRIRAKPKSGKQFVEKIGENYFSVWVKEAAEDGRANRAIIEALAEYLGIAKSRIKIISGLGAKNKIAEIVTDKYDG